MKEGWEYKKFTDVCDVQYGFAFDSKCFTDDDSHTPLIRIRDVQRGYSDTFYNGDIPEGYFINEGDYLVGMDGEFNIGRWGMRPGLLNQRVCKMASSSDLLDNGYMFYFMKVCLKKIEDETSFVTVKHLSAKRINQIQIPLPSIEQQQSIVSELDLINELITKKKAQLKDLDSLAQSLFYEMFGDPVENEKRWEFDTIGNCFPYIKNGANIKQDKSASGIPITRIETLSGGLFNRHRLGYANIFDESKYQGYILDSHDLLMSHINSKTYIGRTVEYIKKNNESIIHGMNLLRLKGNTKLLSTFFAFYTHTSKFSSDIAKIRKDAVNQSSFAISDLRKIELYIPPLPLQQTFASRIEAIEEEKHKIQLSLKDLETLLASRMQYWFD